VLLVVASQRVGIKAAKLCGDDPETLGFETTENLTNEASFNRVRLADDEGAIHGGEATDAAIDPRLPWPTPALRPRCSSVEPLHI